MSKDVGRPPICMFRYGITKALAAAFASKSGVVPNSNISARAHHIVLLADQLVSKLEQLEAGTLEERPTVDTYALVGEIE